MVHHSPPVISVDGLRRVFAARGGEDVVAVDDISLSVPQGETVAILGPNGAGKSTLIRMLTTLLPPSAGSARVAGCDVVRAASRVRSVIGYVGQGNSAGHAQRAKDEVISQARFYGASRDQASRRADELFTTFDLEGMEQRRTREMSGGQRRRLDLAMGLVHNPRLLFLDEPTTGLDPQNRANLWEHIRRLREDTGMTVVLTTHYLDEADAMAERIVIVDNGRILADGSARELKERHVGSHVTLVTSDQPSAHVLAAHLGEAQEVLHACASGCTVRARVTDTRSAMPHLLSLAAGHGITVTRAHGEESTLDDVFLTLTGRSLRDTATTKGSA